MYAPQDDMAVHDVVAQSTAVLRARSSWFTGVKGGEGRQSVDSVVLNRVASPAGTRGCPGAAEDQIVRKSRS